MLVYICMYTYLPISCQVQTLLPSGECFFLVATFLQVLNAGKHELPHAHNKPRPMEMMVTDETYLSRTLALALQ